MVGKKKNQAPNSTISFIKHTANAQILRKTMEQHFEIWDFIQFVMFLGSLTFVLGAVFQIYMAYKNQKISKLKIIPLILLTRILTLILTMIFWFWDIISIDIMLGPILLPALIAEIILCPILLKMFGYKLI